MLKLSDIGTRAKAVLRSKRISPLGVPEFLEVAASIVREKEGDCECGVGNIKDSESVRNENDFPPAQSIFKYKIPLWHPVNRHLQPSENHFAVSL
jgi:hypothetical protein